ncbi:hypothetical protein MAR621_03112 [Maribacter dokdonensis]|uniref:immunoglobulin-like domain-containing protein n=1 Tax=Maribacter dokdonensis TaxID=320912 RepID=UPI001B1BBA7C|nr:immunoglobulin-like domain-containing protein [Maribacter dokdonensis]CAG2532918.1 hypothetical protein MAR621_03112 [Maribacter dokdonensis]
MRNLIFILLFIPLLGISQTKAQRVALFESYWYNTTTNNTYASKASTKSQAVNNIPEQGQYYAGWGFSGALAAFQATGNTDYLDDLIEITYATIAEAEYVSIGNGSTYLGWHTTKHGNNTRGLPLWESYLFRYVATMLRIMYQSPNLRAMNNGSLVGSTYQYNYDELLSWVETHMWDKWVAAGIGNLYRSRTHMASHWARIGQELHIITGEAKYKTVFDDISFDGMSNYNGASIRSRIYNLSNGYSMYQTWESNSLQDTDHASDIMSYIVNAYEQGYYWTADDIQKFINTFKNVIWDNPNVFEFSKYLNGSGTGAAEHLWEWAFLAKYDTELYNRYTAETYPTVDSYFKGHGAGVMLLVQAYREDSVVYPETSSSNPDSTPDPDNTPPTVTSREIQNLTETSAKLRWYIDEGSKGWIVYGTTSDSTEPYNYTYETVHEESYSLTHGQDMGIGFNPPPLTPGTTYYYRTYQEDVAGNSSYSTEGSFTTLSDGTPVITLNGNQLVNLTVGDTYTEFGATWNDGTNTGSATVGGDTVDTTTVGEYVVTYNYTGANEVTRTVIVSARQAKSKIPLKGVLFSIQNL